MSDRARRDTDPGSDRPRARCHHHQRGSQFAHLDDAGGHQVALLEKGQDQIGIAGPGRRG
jgi:hypothetical protein